MRYIYIYIDEFLRKITRAQKRLLYYNNIRIPVMLFELTVIGRSFFKYSFRISTLVLQRIDIYHTPRKKETLSCAAYD